MRAAVTRLGLVWPALVAAAFFALLHAGSPRAAVAHAGVGAAAADTALRPVRSRWFIIWTDAPSDRAAELADTLDDAADCFVQRIKSLGMNTHRTAAPLVCVFFSRHADFLRFAAQDDGVEASWMGGYYSASKNRVVAYDDATGVEFASAFRAVRTETPEGRQRIETLQREAWDATREKLLHEAAHLLAFNTGAQKPGAPYPAWLTEGLAESFARGALGGRMSSAPSTPSTGHCAGAGAPNVRSDYPGAGANPREIDAFYDDSLRLVDAMLSASPESLASLLDDIARAPSDASAAALARAVAARFASQPATGGVVSGGASGVASANDAE